MLRGGAGDAEVTLRKEARAARHGTTRRADGDEVKLWVVLGPKWAAGVGCRELRG